MSDRAVRIVKPENIADHLADGWELLIPEERNACYPVYMRRLRPKTYGELMTESFLNGGAGKGCADG